MKEKAIVRKTNEILDIENHWVIKKMKLSIEFPGFDDLNTVLEENYEYKDTKEIHDEGDHYILSDGKKYVSDELIVGLDNIRDYKITNQIKIDE